MIDQPEMIFAVPINMEYDPDESEEGVFGTFPHPDRYDISLPDVFSGQSYDLIDFCVRYNRGCPPYFIFLQKTVISCENTGWRMRLNYLSYTVSRDQFDVKPFLAERSRNKKKDDAV